MDIPIELDIQLLTGFSVCLFKSTDHAKDSPPHFYVTIPTKSNSYLIMCMATSQLENKISYYKKSNEKCLGSLIIVEKSDLDFLSKKTMIDCNSAHHTHRNDLQKRIVPNTYKFISSNIPEPLKEKIIKAIKDSPAVKPYLKDSIQS